MKYNPGDLVRVNYIKPHTKILPYKTPIVKSVREGRSDYVGYVRTNLKNATGEVTYSWDGGVQVLIIWPGYKAITDQDHFNWSFEEDSDEIELMFSI